MKHVRVFGSLCFKHVPDEKRKKLQDKSVPMILVGYHPTGAYRLLEPLSKKIFISRDVVIDEDGSWDWKKKSTISTLVEEENTEAEIIEETGIEVENDRSAAVHLRPQRDRHLPLKFKDYHVELPNILGQAAVTEDEEKVEAKRNASEFVHFAFLADVEPIDFRDALQQDQWKAAMEEELRAIERNQIWDLVDLPSNQSPIDVKWVFKLKLKPDGSVAKHKARLVARGFLQRAGLDYSEVFAPVARLETIRLVIALAHNRDWSLYQLDVKSAFLNGTLEEEVFVKQPPGFEIKGKEDKVFRLHKALYGLKQAPRAWNKRIDSFLIKESFHKCEKEHGIYVRKNDKEDMIILCLYVDDLLITGSNPLAIEKFKERLKLEFEMTDLGLLSYFLGMEFKKAKELLIMHQQKYTTDLLKRFQMMSCNPASTPVEPGLKLVKDESEKSVDSTLFKQVVGSLRYLCNTRPDISFAVGLISRFSDDPKASHWAAAKRILRYLRGTLSYGILFTKEADQDGFTD